MEAINTILLEIFIIFVAAKIAGEVFERLHQPSVIGELLVGILIGPFALGLVGNPGQSLLDVFHGDAEAARESLFIVHEVLAELGVIVLLFLVGLETKVEELVAVGPRAAVVAILGVLVPFGLGFAYMSLRGETTVTSLFVATAMVATSVGITARVLGDMGVIQRSEARIILAAAVLDDILAVLLLAIVSGVGGGAEGSPVAIIVLAAEAIGFTLFAVFLGTRLVRRYSLNLERLFRIRHAPLVVSLVIMLGLAALAGSIGMAAIIGAFLAGVMLAEAREHYELEEGIRPIGELLIPFFFVFIGTQVDWRLFLDPNLLMIAGIVTALAIVGKLVGCGVGALGQKWRDVAVVGVGMVPRGEVGLIIAGLGRSIGAIPETFFSVVVIMSIVTTIIVPPVLKLLYARQGGPPEGRAVAPSGSAQGR